MPALRVGTLSPEDKNAFINTSQRLGLNPYEFGALVQQESGFNPNVWGGANKGYYGLIQFGGPERQEAGLDPKKIGTYTIAEQLPSVEKWLLGRGYKPGTGIARAYATVLGGNPNADLNAKDSFGTSVAGSLPLFTKGGEKYQQAQKILGDLSGLQTPTPAPTTTASTNQQTGNIYNYYYIGDKSFSGSDTAKNFLTSYLPQLQGITSKFDPISALTNAMFNTTNYFNDDKA